jgi:hypothetical protein
MLPDQLYCDVKQAAAQDAITVTSMVEEALREHLRRRASKDGPATPFCLEPFRGRGLQRGVDLSDGAALADLMDGL